LAEDEGLAPAQGHRHHPLGLFSSRVLVEVFHRSYVMDLDLLFASALLAGFGQQPLFEFCMAAPSHGWIVHQDCLFVPDQRDAAPLGHQRSLVLPLDGDLQALVGLAVHLKRGRVPLPHFGCRRTQFVS